MCVELEKRQHKEEFKMAVEGIGNKTVVTQNREPLKL